MTTTTIVSPMLASGMKAGFDPAGWYAEEKYDGHRVLVSCSETGRDIFGNPRVLAYSRDGLSRTLTTRIRQSLEKFPEGLYDGELLVPGKRSYGVTVLENADELVYQVFDLIRLTGVNLCDNSYEERRQLLVEIFKARGTDSVKLAWSTPLAGPDHLLTLTREVWARDGEGLILKRGSSKYEVGKRSRDWIKVKQLRTAVVTIVGFRPGKMGPCSVTVVRDGDGFETTVKWKNLELLTMIQAKPDRYLGRRLQIEYQERTPDGGYRHPRWDRWVEDWEA